MAIMPEPQSHDKDRHDAEPSKPSDLCLISTRILAGELLAAEADPGHRAALIAAGLHPDRLRAELLQREWPDPFIESRRRALASRPTSAESQREGGA